MSASPPSAGDSREPAGSGKPEVANNQPYLVRVLAYRRFWLMAGVIFGLDQWTKHAINTRLALGSYGPGANIPVFPGFFNLVHVGNTGAAWSMFTGASTLLALLAAGTLLAVFCWRRQLGLVQPVAQVAFGLLCGGIVGNLTDRLLHGHVIDFIDLHFGSYIYPTFNVADSGIFLGVVTYLLWSLRQPPPAASNK
jgi:signal peptidase II